ncbi:MAG: hypothetical protein GY826_01425, partial [Fuerstiella sp.]|nr:hypothetical protein [Fuerstiella sp.]
EERERPDQPQLDVSGDSVPAEDGGGHHHRADAGQDESRAHGDGAEDGEDALGVHPPDATVGSMVKTFTV